MSLLAASSPRGGMLLFGHANKVRKRLFSSCTASLVPLISFPPRSFFIAPANYLLFGPGTPHRIMAAHATFSSACLWLLFILHSVGASQIASFVNEHYNAPQVIRYDPDTKLIMYSLCNSNGTPVFPANSSAAFDTKPYTPIVGTHISLTGYIDEEKGTLFVSHRHRFGYYMLTIVPETAVFPGGGRRHCGRNLFL